MDTNRDDKVLALDANIDDKVSMSDVRSTHEARVQNLLPFIVLVCSFSLKYAWEKSFNVNKIKYKLDILKFYKKEIKSDQRVKFNDFIDFKVI